MNDVSTARAYIIGVIHEIDQSRTEYNNALREFEVASSGSGFSWNTTKKLGALVSAFFSAEWASFIGPKDVSFKVWQHDRQQLKDNQREYQAETPLARGIDQLIHPLTDTLHKNLFKIECKRELDRLQSVVNTAW